MTGLEKIIGEIRREGQMAADDILAVARQEADQIAQAARAQAEAQVQKIRQEAAAQAEDIARRAQSAADLKKRGAVLAAKQQLIAQCIDSARRSLAELDDAAYAALLIKMAAAFAHPEPGEICLRAGDLERLPADFAQKLQAALPAGAALQISGESRDIDGGFVLVYGGIEENCSFQALFDADLEKLQDLVQHSLFG